MQTLEKTSSESKRFDIDCSLPLDTGETITSVTSIAADANAGSVLTFGSPVINAAPVTYIDQFGSSRTAPVGQVIQVNISGGSIPTGRLTLNYTIRAKFATTVNPLVEATVRLRLNDSPQS